MNEDTTKNKITEKIIQLDNPKSVELAKENFLLEDEYLEFAEKLVIARVNEIRDYITINGKDDDKEYRQLRMHDMIMVAGRRGSGKTTFLMNLRRRIKEHDTLKEEVKVLNIIDPTLLHGNSDILLLVLAGIYTKITEDFKKDSNKSNKKNQFNTIKEHLQKLHRTINLAYKFKKDEDLEEDNYDRLHGLHKGLELDKDLHEFFKLVCDYYGVKALILPIDDIDMDFEHGYNVFDAIRKYLSTPRVLPISSMDLNQAHSIIKKKQYEYFGYKANTSKYDIEEESDLKFLRRLPEEFLTKISLPTRRVLLPDMNKIYESYISDKVFKNIYFEFTNKSGVYFRLEFEDIVKKFINIVYGVEINGFNEMEQNSYSEYLGNKSIRSFFEDMRAFLNCIVVDKNDNKKLIFNKESLIKRYIPDAGVKYTSKYDAAQGLWREYIKLTKNQLEEYNNIAKSQSNNILQPQSNKEYSPIINNVKKTFYINGEDNDHTIKSKTYMRLYLQDFFISSYKIKLKDFQLGKVIKKFKINKILNISGTLEFSLRTFIPQYLFEALISKEDNISFINGINIEKFESFARDDLKEVAQKLSLMKIELTKDKNATIMAGVNLSPKEQYLIKSNTSVFVLEESSNLDVDYLSFFKMITIIIELLRSKNNAISIKEILPNYVTIKNTLENDSNSDRSYIGHEIDKVIESYQAINKLSFNIENTGFGLKELSRFSKEFINNIFFITDNNEPGKYLENYKEHLELNFGINDLEIESKILKNDILSLEIDLKEKILSSERNNKNVLYNKQNININHQNYNNEIKNLRNKLNKKTEELKRKEFELNNTKIEYNKKMDKYNNLQFLKYKEFVLYGTAFFNKFMTTLILNILPNELRYQIFTGTIKHHFFKSRDTTKYIEMLDKNKNELIRNVTLLLERETFELKEKEVVQFIELIKSCFNLVNETFEEKVFENNAENENS